jgi:ribosome-associated toxin RatA of RatAB toxin-antitoxin module
MKFLKKLLVSFLVIILLAVVASFFLPSDVHIERDRVIDAAPTLIYDQVADLENWPGWMPWLKLDPNMKISYGDTSYGAGAWYSWTSENPDVGAGKLTIVAAEEGKSIKTKLEVEGMGTSNSLWSFDEVKGGTKVTWGLDADMSSPMVIGKFIGLMMEGVVGPDFENGLASIDSIVSLMPAVPEYSIEIFEETVESYPYLARTDSCVLESDSISSAYGRCYGMVGTVIAEQDALFAGKPFVLNDRWAPETGWFWFTAGIPVDNVTTGTDAVHSGMSYAGNVVRAIHLGPYDSLPASHEEIAKYIADKGLESNGATWEQYVDDLTAVSEAECRTFIFYPVK